MPLPGHPLMIAGIDTIANNDGGHRGTGGGVGEEQGWIMVQGKYHTDYETFVRWQIGECQVARGAGRCMYVHGMACMCDIYLLSKHRLPHL